MEWVETTGRTIEEALEAALDELGVSEDEIEYEVLEQPRAGLFGRFGGTEARLRTRIKPISREKPGERRRRRRDEARPNEARPNEARPNEGRTDARRSEGRSEKTTNGPARDRDDSPSAGPSRSRNRRRRPPGERPPRAEESTAMESTVSLEEQADFAGEFARGLLERFGLTGTVATRVEEDDDVFVDIAGDDLGLLIGPKAATLDALQELVKTAVQRRTGGASARLHVDVSGYRARRHEALAVFARSAASLAIETGHDQVLEPMSASDRKVVHDAMAEIDGVTTVSEGEEPRRRVVIRPA